MARLVTTQIPDSKALNLFCAAPGEEHRGQRLGPWPIRAKGLESSPLIVLRKAGAQRVSHLPRVTHCLEMEDPAEELLQTPESRCLSPMSQQSRGSEVT